jgi:hypothetical protein
MRGFAFSLPLLFMEPGTVARSDAVVVGSNPTHGMDVWRVYLFILCLWCPAFS